MLPEIRLTLVEEEERIRRAVELGEVPLLMLGMEFLLALPPGRRSSPLPYEDAVFSFIEATSDLRAINSAFMVFISANRSARVGSAMVAERRVESVEGDGDGGCGSWSSAAEVDAEDRRTRDTRLSRAW